MWDAVKEAFRGKINNVNNLEYLYQTRRKT